MRGLRALPFAAVALVVGALLIGCGGDDDENGSGAKQENGDIARPAQRLETYLKSNTKDLSGSQAERGQVVSSVQPTDGKLKVFTGLNADATVDDDRRGRSVAWSGGPACPRPRAQSSWMRATR